MIKFQCNHTKNEFKLLCTTFIHLLVILGHTSRIYTQSVPISPCPKIFQYRFDGSEWFGVISVRNPDFGQPIHLRVILSLRGKPATNYLGEIELLTRGQYFSATPVLYKIKFPKNSFPPRLLQIAMNNQVICVGTADHSIFVTQIQLEHTRRFTFIPSQVPSPMQQASPSSPSLLTPAADAMEFAGEYSPSLSSVGMKELSIMPSTSALDTEHLSSLDLEQNSKRLIADICGTIDDRIRFQVLHKLRQARDSMDSFSRASFDNQADNIDSLLLSTLWPPRNEKVPLERKVVDYADESRDDETIARNDNVDENLPPLITIDTESMSDDAALDTGSMSVNKLPSITRGAWPWLAAIYVNNLTSLAYQCGGTLVSTRVVISAAHCFHLFKQRYMANEVLVFLGRHNLKNWNEEGSLAAPVEDIFTHPDYNPQLNSYDADIAVVILKNEVRFNTFIRPACMWSGPDKQRYIEGEHGIVVGWGLGGFNTTKFTLTTSTVPKIVSIPIVSNAVCFKANSKLRNLSSSRTFCAGIVIPEDITSRKTKMMTTMKTTTTTTSRKKGITHFHQHLHQGPCAGDSGSGLMIFKNNRWMLRGTVTGTLPLHSSAEDFLPLATSRSSRGCIINQYVIYTDVAKFLDWIFAFTL